LLTPKPAPNNNNNKNDYIIQNDKVTAQALQGKMTEEMGL